MPKEARRTTNRKVDVLPYTKDNSKVNSKAKSESKSYVDTDSTDGIVLKAGVYVIGDPCYVLEPRVYDSLVCDGEFKVLKDATDNGPFHAIEKYTTKDQSMEMIAFRGSGGVKIFTDGQDGRDLSMDLPMDSGLIAVLPLSLVNLNLTNDKSVYMKKKLDKRCRVVLENNGELFIQSLKEEKTYVTFDVTFD
jgi:hypothetical protein